ncbi:MAG: dissimilatory sulfite reductase-asociated protein DsvD [Deltaproteobacteria bacterium]|nr:MAG: dissimilatory sulfite reductase-asociated protein DsvD [Deltaproteobacteria bacterium]
MALPDNAKEMILEQMKKKSKTKSKFYFNDLSKMFPDESPRAVKKVVNEMVSEGSLEYWSSGSTTMYGIPGMGDLG